MNHDNERHAPRIQLLPADGWRVYYYVGSENENEDRCSSIPVIAWGLHACGCIVPLGCANWINVSDLRTANTIAVFREDEPLLDELIETAIEDWKAKRDEAVNETMN